MLIADLRLTLCCPVCGCIDVPSILDRQPLVCHVDPTTRRICPNRQGAVRILRHPVDDDGGA